MSEVGDDSTMVYSIKYGACYYLVKPIQMGELKKIWIHVLKHRISKCFEVPPRRNEEKKERMIWTPEMREIFHQCYLGLRSGVNPFPALILSFNNLLFLQNSQSN